MSFSIKTAVEIDICERTTQLQWRILLISYRLVKLSLFMFVLSLKLVSFYFQQTTGLFRVCILRSSKSCQP